MNDPERILNAIPGPGDLFPDLELPDHRGKMVRLSFLTRPGGLDPHLGFTDGLPLILVFYRGFFCPRDQQQFRDLCTFQAELQVNFARLACVSVDPPTVGAAFRAGLGAEWPFLSDESRGQVTRLGLLDDTEGEYAYRSRPLTFVLRPDLTVYSAYDGWYFVGRPTLDELRQDLRAIMSSSRAYPYEAWTSDAVRAVRISQQTWTGGAPELGSSGFPVLSGTVRTFDLRSGNGTITVDRSSEQVFFNFTALPGEGYRTVAAGAAVRFEAVEGVLGRTARNVQPSEPPAVL